MRNHKKGENKNYIYIYKYKNSLHVNMRDVM